MLTQRQNSATDRSVLREKSLIQHSYSFPAKEFSPEIGGLTIYYGILETFSLLLKPYRCCFLQIVYKPLKAGVFVILIQLLVAQKYPKWHYLMC